MSGKTTKSVIEDRYLGDGVYASFDGFGITLDLRKQDNFTRVVLEPEVYDALVKFYSDLVKAAAERRKEGV